MNDINYSKLIDSAMRGLVQDLLRQVAKTGLPSDHHFYITFRTDMPGVSISKALKSRYPEKMTIVMQYQFWDFVVEEDQFSVSLSFSGVPEKLTIPYYALTEFVDPSVKFVLQFQAELPESIAQSLPAVREEAELPMRYEDVAIASGEDVSTIESGEEENTAAEIISLDAFRKK